MYPSVPDLLLLSKSQKVQDAISGLVLSHPWQQTDVLVKR